MRYNKVECSTPTGPYYTTHDVKVPFCMPEFSSRKIISHRFYVDKNKGKSGIDYNMTIGRVLMVQLQLGLSADLNHQVLQWDGVILPMK